MLASNLTSKGQTTIPVEVRKALGLHPGDRVMFEIKNHKAIISRIEPLDYEYYHALESTLEEWASPSDEEAYRDL